ncbi:Chromosomal replication initiator protein DnaA [bioreactor metagenome]|uniref:Chromosomal replication initiator protein DnaA n=1 Tax=bioreactor metagenome TaxID=1076179 RepID=A0A645GP69_9ZZZZ
MEQRLLSRFEWGITVDIKPPDYETRTAILMRKAQLLVRRDDNILPIQNEVYHYIASKVTSDIRKLEGALRKVIMYAEFNREGMKLSKIDLALAEKALENYLNDAKPKALTPAYIIDMVCRQFDIKPEEIKGKQKNREFAYPRQIAMYILRNVTELSYTKIADYFEKKDHTTVIYAVDKIAQQMDEDVETKNVIEDLIMRIKQ